MRGSAAGGTMTPLPITLAAAAACALLNIWLGARVVRSRRAHGVRIGDGGNEAVLRRMRAQVNFTENAPFVLILLGGLELSGARPLGLGLIAAIFVLARIFHPIGMEGPEKYRWRMIGMMGSTFVTLALSFWAIIDVVTWWLGR